MSSDPSAEPALAGEDAPSSSEGLRPDTRTSNNEMWDGRPATSRALEPPPSSTSDVRMQGIQQKIQQLEKETAQPERREAARARKKLTREVQRTLAEAGRSDADKIKYLESMFSEQVTQQARLENQLIPLRRQCDTASKERDSAIDEKARVVELNSKLHELCRELRKENALLLDTSKAISAQELSQRKSLTENFQETVEGITRRLEEHETDRLRVVGENEVLKAKLKALCEQYEARDSHYTKQLQTKDLELRMADIKSEEQAVLVESAEAQSEKMAEAFTQMQTHKLETDKLLESYNERFSECQHSIEKSNEVFKMLRQDGERKAQQLKKSERDRRIMNKQHQEVQQRLEQSNARLVQLMEENTNLKKTDTSEKARLKAQNEMLQSLCRTLRDEVKHLKTGTSIRSPSAAAHSPASSPVPSETSLDVPASADRDSGMETDSDQNGRDASISLSASAELSDAMSQGLTISAEDSITSIGCVSLTR